MRMIQWLDDSLSESLIPTEAQFRRRLWVPPRDGGIVLRVSVKVVPLTQGHIRAYGYACSQD